MRTWSFGAVQAPRDPSAQSWSQRRGTLDDQRIFGPEKDWECACGKYRGMKYEGMVCDRCGVKVTSREARRTRFGHFELPQPVPHPLGATSEQLSAVPVLPAAFWQAPAGTLLAQAYDDLARVVSTGVSKAPAMGHEPMSDIAAQWAAEILTVKVHRLVDVLLPVVVFAHEWDLAEGQTLARGLALEHRMEEA